METMADRPAAFVVPFWTEGEPRRMHYLQEALASIAAQTDQNFLVVVVERRPSPCWASPPYGLPPAPCAIATDFCTMP